MRIDFGFKLTRLEVAVKRHQLETPVRTSFGVMTSRPAVFVRVTDQSGTQGYGEIWCNFPSCGAEHRAALFETEIAPRIRDLEFTSPQSALAHMEKSLRVLKLQTGEVGPICQAIAAADIAIWDMIARRAGKPLYRVLGGNSPKMQVYGSGINPEGVVHTVQRLQSEGYTKFKLKVGFSAERDTENVKYLVEQLRPQDEFMVDANQAWSLQLAREALTQIEEFSPKWVEEPLPADSPIESWLELKSRHNLKIAGGENYDTMEQYKTATEIGFLDFVQPDICKWGGMTGCLEVARHAANQGSTMCPHSLGAGIALAASAHLLAASNQPGILEVDGNPNPLREDIFPIRPQEGVITLTDQPGLGVDPDLMASFFD